MVNKQIKCFWIYFLNNFFNFEKSKIKFLYKETFFLKVIYQSVEMIGNNEKNINFTSEAKNLYEILAIFWTKHNSFSV